MSQPQETSHDPFKPWKSFVFPTEKSANFFSLLVRGSLLIFLVVSVSLVIYSALSTHSQWFKCPECDSAYRNSGHQSKIHLPCSNKDYETTNISHILFGIGGSVKTWKDRWHYSELWWQPNITRGYVWLDEKIPENEPWPETGPPYRVSEDTSTFKFTTVNGRRSAIRIARIVSESFRLGLENVRWFVMGDDDTVFFTDNLISVLRKYDHNQMYYVGGNSESVEQDVMHSYGMAFGGGGFAVSYPLAAELVRVLDGCIDHYSSFYGSDQRIQACLSEIGVPLTLERGFHQIDIRGDPYGILAAHPVAPLVSLHHLDHVKPLFPSLSSLDSLKLLVGAYKADPGRTLQQSFCYDLKRNWSVSVAWGYTAQIYPFLLSAKDLETVMRTFQTWRSWSNQPFTFNTRQISSNPCERPLIYFLDWVRSGLAGTLTTYKRFMAKPGKDCDQTQYAKAVAVKTIKVTASNLDPNQWSKAPRRQCCEIKRSGGVKEVQVTIRNCNSRETVTIP